MGLVRLATLAVLALASAACASSGAIPRPFPGASAPDAPPAPGPPGVPSAPGAPGAPPAPRVIDVAAVVDTALGLRGVPYRNGGSDPKGFDCSGLVQYVFAQHGLAVPRDVREQVRLGREVRLAGIEKGDLIFFATTTAGASHVGVALGGDEFIHAPSTRGVVRVEKFSAPYWARRIVAVRRWH
ncbi:MAG: C40 family peptidase [Vicinamibacterales bacterium]